MLLAYEREVVKSRAGSMAGGWKDPFYLDLLVPFVSRQKELELAAQEAGKANVGDYNDE